MADDFETCPAGTLEKLKQFEELETWARKASAELSRLAAGGRYESPTVLIAGQHYCDPLFCAARVETRIRNAAMRHPPFGRSR